MKLLLTSAGFTNKSIIKSLKNLVGKPFNKLNLAFIPTAANVEDGSKDWLINDLNNCNNLKFKSIDIVDISALPKKIWKSRLDEADILFFGGGNTRYLMYWIEKSGLKKLLPKMLKEKIYVGSSAGSMVLNTKLYHKNTNILYNEKAKYGNNNGLGFVLFYFLPHYKSPCFDLRNKKNLKKMLEKTSETVYALDDNSAIQVINDDIKIISEGEWLKFN